MVDERESVKVSAENWRRLNARKEPGDSFNDVVSRLLDESDGEPLVE